MVPVGEAQIELDADPAVAEISGAGRSGLRRLRGDPAALVVFGIKQISKTNFIIWRCSDQLPSLPDIELFGPGSSSSRKM